MRCALVLGLLGACALDEPQTRARIDDEPVGENCAEGGIAVRTGLDADEDKLVGDNELTAETYLCKVESEATCAGKVRTGRVTLATFEDAEKLDGVTCIEGDLVIASNTMFELLGTSSLHTVIGHVVIAGNPSLSTLDGLDALRMVTGTVLIQGNDGLVDLGAIKRLQHGDLEITANDYLVDLQGLDGMTEAPGAITITANPELATLRGLDGLTTSAYSIAITANGQLTSLEALGHLQSAGIVTISDNAALATIDLPALSTVDGLRITNSRALSRVSLPALAGARSGIVVEHNAALDELSMPVLDDTSGITIAGKIRRIELPQLGFIEGVLKLDDLESLAGFAGVYEVGELRLANVGSLDGLASLAVVDGDFVVHGSTLRKAARALADRIEIKGAIAIE